MVKIDWKDYWQVMYECCRKELLEDMAPILASSQDVQVAHIQTVACRGQVGAGMSIEHYERRMSD